MCKSMCACECVCVCECMCVLLRVLLISWDGGNVKDIGLSFFTIHFSLYKMCDESYEYVPSSITTDCFSSHYLEELQQEHNKKNESKCANFYWFCLILYTSYKLSQYRCIEEKPDFLRQFNITVTLLCCFCSISIF